MKWVLGLKRTLEISTFLIYLLRDIVRNELSVRADMVIVLALMGFVPIVERKKKPPISNGGLERCFLSKITNVNAAITNCIVYFLGDEI